MKRTIYRIFVCLLLPAVLWQCGAAAEKNPEPQDLYARSAVLLDGTSGRILFGKNEKEILPMASTTKIMTCILALENGEPDDVVTVSQNAAAQPEVHLGMKSGETFYLNDLLYSLMLESHNDSAVAIAEHIGGSVSGFAEMMNQKAAELGCVNTHFVTPNGLDDSDEGGAHGTTAEELAKIMAYCVSASPAKEEFLHITQTRSSSFTNAEGSRSFSCYNHNAFLDMMEGAISGKTGFTSAAGYCYVGALKSDGRLFIVALLACGWPYNRDYKWSDTRTLMNYGKENFENRTVRFTKTLDPLPVQGGFAGEEDLWRDALADVKPKIPDGEEKVYLLRRDEQIVERTSIKKQLLAPVEKGSVVGKVSYYLGSELLAEYPIVTAEAVEARCFAHWFQWVCRRYLL